MEKEEMKWERDPCTPPPVLNLQSQSSIYFMLWYPCVALAFCLLIKTTLIMCYYCFLNLFRCRAIPSLEFLSDFFISLV